jgi:FKBP-type peptidyl-prolyl cis-trans isomerase
MKARDGDTVKVHYTGKLENGEVLTPQEKTSPLN